MIVLITAVGRGLQMVFLWLGERGRLELWGRYSCLSLHVTAFKHNVTGDWISDKGIVCYHYFIITYLTLHRPIIT